MAYKTLTSAFTSVPRRFGAVTEVGADLPLPAPDLVEATGARYFRDRFGERLGRVVIEVGLRDVRGGLGRG